MTVIYEANENRPHFCTTADNSLPLGSICRCECGRFWLRKTVIGDYWVGSWVPVRWYHRAARRRIKEWQGSLQSVKDVAAGIVASGQPQTLANKTLATHQQEVEKRIMSRTDDWEALHRWRQADDTTPTRFRVTVKLYGSPFDDAPYSEATWQGTRFQIGEMAGEYADESDNPLLHMEIGTVEVLADE